MDIVEGIRKALVEVLVPEFRQLRDDIDKRFEQVDKRFEQVDKRFEQVDKRFEQMHEEIMGLKSGQNEILARLDVVKRLTRLEARVEKLARKKVS